MIGTINFQEGMFLGKEELALWRDHIYEVQRRAMLGGDTEYGVYDNFQNVVTVGLSNGQLKLSYNVSGTDYLAGADVNGFIVVPGTDNANELLCDMTGHSTGDELFIRHTETSWERSTITISANSNTVTGTGSDFTSKLRNSIKGRYSRIETEDGDIYNIQSIYSDTLMYLIDNAAKSFTGKWRVLPTLSTFYSGEDSEPLYKYDFAEIGFDLGEGAVSLGTITKTTDGSSTYVGITWNDPLGFDATQQATNIYYYLYKSGLITSDDVTRLIYTGSITGDTSSSDSSSSSGSSSSSSSSNSSLSKALLKKLNNSGLQLATDDTTVKTL